MPVTVRTQSRVRPSLTRTPTSACQETAGTPCRGILMQSGHPVLVVTVAPPQPGQRAFTLRKDLTVTTPGGSSKGYPAGTIFVRYPGRTEIAGPGDIRALEDRYAAPALESARAAEASTRRSLEIQQERQAAEELERRRTRLMEIADLVIGAQPGDAGAGQPRLLPVPRATQAAGCARRHGLRAGTGRDARGLGAGRCRPGVRDIRCRRPRPAGNRGGHAEPDAAARPRPRARAPWDARTP